MVQVPWRRKGDATSVEERTATKPGPHAGAPGNTYTHELLDRAANMRTACAEFERRQAHRDGPTQPGEA